MGKEQAEESHPSHATTTGPRRVLGPTPSAGAVPLYDLRTGEAHRPQVSPSSHAPQHRCLSDPWTPAPRGFLLASVFTFLPLPAQRSYRIGHTHSWLLQTTMPSPRPDSLPSLSPQKPHPPLFTLGEGASPEVRVSLRRSLRRSLRTSQVFQTWQPNWFGPGDLTWQCSNPQLSWDLYFNPLHLPAPWQCWPGIHQAFPKWDPQSAPATHPTFSSTVLAQQLWVQLPSTCPTVTFPPSWWRRSGLLMVRPAFSPSRVCVCVHAKSLQSCPTLFDPVDYSHQAPLPMGFSRQEYQRGLPYPPPGNLTNLGIKLAFLMSPVFTGGFFTTSAPWEASAKSNQPV